MHKRNVHNKNVSHWHSLPSKFRFVWQWRGRVFIRLIEAAHVLARLWHRLILQMKLTPSNATEFILNWNELILTARTIDI